LLAIRHSKANSTAICDYFTANIFKNQQSTLWQEPQQQQQRQEPQNQFQLSTQSHKQEKSPQKRQQNHNKTFTNIPSRTTTNKKANQQQEKIVQLKSFPVSFFRCVT